MVYSVIKGYWSLQVSSLFRKVCSSFSNRLISLGWLAPFFQVNWSVSSGLLLLHPIGHSPTSRNTCEREPYCNLFGELTRTPTANCCAKERSVENRTTGPKSKETSGDKRQEPWLRTTPHGIGPPPIQMNGNNCRKPRHWPPHWDD